MYMLKKDLIYKEKFFINYSSFSINLSEKLISNWIDEVSYF